MSEILIHLHVQVSAALGITAVRVQGDHGFLLLGSRTAPASYLGLRRQDGAWLVEGLLPGRLP